MQVARYWRLKQHLYQLTVNDVIDQDADKDAPVALNVNTTTSEKASTVNTTMKSEKLATVA